MVTTVVATPDMTTAAAASQHETINTAVRAGRGGRKGPRTSARQHNSNHRDRELALAAVRVPAPLTSVVPKCLLTAAVRAVGDGNSEKLKDQARRNALPLYVATSTNQVPGMKN